MTTILPSDQPAMEGAKTKHSRRLIWVAGGIVVAWFLVAEAVNYAWYASHESSLAPNHLPATGDVVLARLKTFVTENGGRFKEQGIGDAAMDMLKCTYGSTLIWATNDDKPLAVTAIRWGDRSIVSGLESMHNPGNCLRAAGWTIGEKTEFGVENYCGATCEVTQWEVAQGGQQMLAYSAVFRRFAAAPPEAGRTGLWQNNRMQPVLAGRRDAPVLIVLAYLPIEGFGDGESGHDRFQRIMKTVFCPPPSGEPAP